MSALHASGMMIHTLGRKKNKGAVSGLDRHL